MCHTPAKNWVKGHLVSDSGGMKPINTAYPAMSWGMAIFSLSGNVAFPIITSHIGSKQIFTKFGSPRKIWL